MNVRSIVLSAAVFAFASTTVHAALASTPAPHATMHPKKLKAKKPVAKMTAKPMMLKAVAPSHPGPQ